MTPYTTIIEEINRLSSFSEKANFLRVILNSLEKGKTKITPECKKELSEFAFGEIKKLIALIPSLESYEEKGEVFAYEDLLLGIVMHCYASPTEICESDLNNVKALAEIVNKERFVENAIDAIFKDKQYDKATVEQLLCLVVPLKDEIQKGQVYNGLLHYKNEIKKLPPDSKKLFADHISSELKRYLASSIDETIVNCLEIACDAAKYFMNDTIISLLNDVLKLEKNNINYFAVETLLSANQTIPSKFIELLANDIVYADMTYSLLDQYGLTGLYPTELSNTEYLAKSKMVHWLVYPTELGEQPEKIEYLGKVKKKEEYHILRYMSHSDNLSDELKGQWLIGWASENGGTFSNFDLYSEFEQKNIEKTLKNIKKRLL